MSRRTFAILFFAFIVSFPLFGDDAFTITPTAGPSAGGTEVVVTGPFGSWPYVILFGGVPATNLHRLSDNSFAATTPPHLPGVSELVVFEYDIGLSTDQTFTFTGGVPSSFERLLLPIFVPPVNGQFGSRFVTDFSAFMHNGESNAQIFGLAENCACTPRPLIDYPYSLYPSAPRVDESRLTLNGTPGRFIYVPANDVSKLAMNLRVHDTSRATANFGTEIPVVRARQFINGYQPMTLLNVPTDPKFRNTLRIYSTTAWTSGVRIEGAGFAPIETNVTLTPGADIFTPATATFTNFPSNVGPVTVTIQTPIPPITPVAAPDVWAFVSVTNNETQLITTITPQP
jgi:hypothetical protein